MHNSWYKTFLVTAHTDFVGKNSTFVAIKGTKCDGASYIKTALEKGAARIIVAEGTTLPSFILEHIKNYGIELIFVENTRKALAVESACAYNYPAKKLRIIGVTGTKGKSSTVFLLAHMLQSAGYKTALLSTIENRICGTSLPSSFTTPLPDYTHAFLADCVNQEVEIVIMEVAAQGITCHRLESISFDGIIFTNFSHEHGEFYATQKEYFDAKCSLVDYLKPDGFIILNRDDAAVNSLSTHPNSRGFSLCENISNKDDIKVLTYTSALSGIYAKIGIEKEIVDITCPVLMGVYNIYNIVGALSAAYLLGVDLISLKKACSSFSGVPGRLSSYIVSTGAKVFIDYAHNQASYEAVLSTLRPITDNLIVVFGAGGERDSSKRPVMGSLVAYYSNIGIITSDNPRSEDPNTIIADISSGISLENKKKMLIIPDRFEAIKKAVSLSNAHSVIAILGKGMDEYQLIGDKKLYFSEREILSTL